MLDQGAATLSSTILGSGKKARMGSTLARYMSKRFRIRFDYKKKVYIARARSDGTINYRGKIYTSPSAAAMAITKRPIDGWWAWKYQRAPGDWIRLDELRR